MLRVCITALNAYPAIDPQSGGSVGGVETRAWTFAKGLARLPATEVFFVVRHSKPFRESVVDRVKIVPLIDRLSKMREAVSTMLIRESRFPWLKLHGFHPCLLWQLPIVGIDFLKRRLLGQKVDYQVPMQPIASVDADVYVTFGVVNMTSAAVIATAHARSRPAVLFLGSDSDLDERYTPDSTYVSPYGDPGWLCAWIIAQADVIVAQTASQQQRLSDLFGRTSERIENPIDVDRWDDRAKVPLTPDRTAGLERYVLWVGRAEGIHKRPQLMLDVARACPEVDFLMILNPREPVLEARIRRDVPVNLRIIPHVPFDDMPAVFSRAVALVSTSSLEGFPNVFLQAAIARVPIASLVVGDDFLRDSEAGICTHGDIASLATQVSAWWSGSRLDEARATRVRDYVTTRHGLESQVRGFHELLERTADAGRRG